MTFIAAIAGTGDYTGDGNNNKAIAHGLGIVPKVVYVYTAASYYAIIQSNGELYQNTTATYYSQTAIDGTNFYVGTVGSEIVTMNVSSTAYKWVAFG